MKKKKCLKPPVMLAAVAILAATMLLAGCGDEKRAATMHLVATAGTVGVQDEEANEVSLKENLGLYSGYQVGTKSESYAWIDLDQTKLAKMDQDSEIEIQKQENEKELEIFVQSGSMYFNVTEPLAEDESMDVQTSTMIAGIRGTCGWMERGAEYSRVGLLEGTVECRTMDGVSVFIEAGQMAVLADGESEISVLPLYREDIPTFIRDEAEELIMQLPEEMEESLYDPKVGLELPEIPQDGINRQVIEVADADTLMELALGEDLSNTEIHLGDGTYELNYFGLHGHDNLSIIGTGDTRLVVNNGYELILEAINCKNLLIYGLVMGHELPPQASGCTAGVLYLSNCQDVRVIGCDIYGCGLIGISGRDTSLTAQNTVIRECSQSALDWMGGGGDLRFENCIFSENGSNPLFTGNAANLTVTLENCVMQNNLSDKKYSFYREEEGEWKETNTKETGNAWQSITP